MPEIRENDDRAHFAAGEKAALAHEIMALIETRLTEGMGDAPGCRQCIASVGALIYAKAVLHASESEHVGEILGATKGAVQMVGYLNGMVNSMKDAAVLAALKDNAGLSQFMAALTGKVPVDG